MATKREDDASYWKARKLQHPTPAAQPVPTSNTPKSGIHPTAEVLPCEDRSAHDALIARYYQRFRPTKPEECCYVDEIVYCEWTLRRLRRTDTELNLFVHQECFETDEDFPVGQPAADNPKVFSALQWRFNGTRRALRNAIDALRDLRANPIPDPFPETPAATEAIQTPSPSIGFVPGAPGEPRRLLLAPCPLLPVPTPEPTSPTATNQSPSLAIGFVPAHPICGPNEALPPANSARTKACQAEAPAPLPVSSLLMRQFTSDAARSTNSSCAPGRLSPVP